MKKKIKDLPFIKFLIAYRNYYKYLKKVSPKEDTWYFIIHYCAAGDVYLILSLLDEFKQQHASAKVTFIVTYKSFIDIIDLFGNAVNVIFCPLPEPIPLNKFLQFKKGKIINLHPFYYLPSVSKLVGFKEVTLFDVFKVLLNIPLNTLPSHPSRINPPEEEKAIIKRFKDLNLRTGRTVILAPDAFSIPQIEPVFWNSLAKQLKALNYDVALMSYKGGYESLDIINIKFSFKEAVTALNHAGFLIAIRSGFCDIVCTSTIPKVILYPKMTWLGGDLIKGASLKQLERDERQTFFELEYCNHKDEETVRQVVDIIERA